MYVGCLLHIHVVLVWHHLDYYAALQKCLRKTQERRAKKCDDNHPITASSIQTQQKTHGRPSSPSIKMQRPNKRVMFPHPQSRACAFRNTVFFVILSIYCSIKPMSIDVYTVKITPHQRYQLVSKRPLHARADKRVCPTGLCRPTTVRHSSPDDQ